MQRGFYDENARRVLLANPYSEQCETLRQLCCHPAACEQWEKWRKAAGSVGSATPLEGLRKKMLHHKQQALEHTTADVRTRSAPSRSILPSSLAARSPFDSLKSPSACVRARAHGTRCASVRQQNNSRGKGGGDFLCDGAGWVHSWSCYVPTCRRRTTRASYYTTR